MPSPKKRKGKVVGWLAQIRMMRQQKSKLCDTKAEALDLEAQWRREIQAEMNRTTPTVLEWLTRYLEHIEQRNTPRTFEEKKEAAAIAYHGLGQQTTLDQVTQGEALSVLQRVAERRSGYAANKVRKNLIAAWNWGAKYMEGVPQQNPFAQVERFPSPKSSKHVPPMEDVQAVLNLMPEEDACMLLCYLHTAARRDEIFRLRWEDIDFPRSKITLWTRKRKGGAWEPDTIPMTQTLREALLRQRARSEGQGLVFTWGGRKYKERRHWLAHWCGIARVPRFTIQSIRHLAASWLDAHNVPLTTIQAILRHKSATTTARYLHDLRGVQADLDSVFRDQQEGKILDMKRASTGTSDGGSE